MKASGGSNSRNAREHLANLLPLIASLLLTVSIGEGFARYQLSAWPFEREARVLSYLTPRDEPLRWRFPPREGRNSLGLRNREIGNKGEHQLRILFLGDSLIWSGETSSGALYTELVEARLNEELGTTGRQIEVINAGVPGYTTYQELEFLKAYGLDMQPDLVVLGFVFNDVYYKYLHTTTERQFLDFDPTLKLHRFNTRSFPGALFARSYLAHESFYALETLVKRITGRPDFPFEHRDDFYLAWKDYGWEDAGRLIAQMRELLRQNHSRMTMIIFPISDQVNDRYRSVDEQYVLYPQKRVTEICRDQDVPCLDLTDPLYRNGGAALYRDYLHLNGRGNDIVVDWVTRHLVQTAPLWWKGP